MPMKIILLGGVAAAAEAKRQKPMDSNEGSAINAPAPRRKCRRLNDVFMFVLAGCVSFILFRLLFDGQQLQSIQNHESDGVGVGDLNDRLCVRHKIHRIDRTKVFAIGK